MGKVLEAQQPRDKSLGQPLGGQPLEKPATCVTHTKLITLPVPNPVLKLQEQREGSVVVDRCSGPASALELPV